MAVPRTDLDAGRGSDRSTGTSAVSLSKCPLGGPERTQRLWRASGRQGVRASLYKGQKARNRSSDATVVRDARRVSNRVLVSQ